MGNRSGYSAKCGRCDGKGWLPDRTEATLSTDLESQTVLEALKEHTAGLNIDDISRISRLDIPAVYRALQKLRESGAVGVKSGSPVVYYAIKTTAQKD
jgi:hypothetical protein